MVALVSGRGRTRSNEDQAHVRQSFLTEASELKRAWLAELLEGVQPTGQTLVWLLSSLEKSESKGTYTIDRLADGITEFVGTADIELLPQLVSGLNRLLSLPPMIERRYCEVSEKFQWLIAPASKAVERLIMSRHPASIELDALAILHKFSVARGYGSDDMTNVKDEFSKLVPAWQELNRTLFWFEVQRSRETIDRKHQGRLTSVQQVSIFGSFWQFEEGDFEYVAEEISRQTLLDDKLVALSLAFDLYRMANRPRAWCIKLKKFVAGNDELSEQLDNYLKPPAQSEDLRRSRQEQAGWKRRDEARRKKQEKKQEKYHADWKSYLNDNLEEVRAALCEKPGTLIKPLHYLSKHLQVKKHVSGRWTEYNWKTLIPEYGEEVARFYRDSTVSFWQHHEPKLRSEGTPLNETPHAVIIGLTGLEIEAHETKGWPKNLNTVEVERACRYASFELNGFPTWFPKLFETYPKIVCDFLMREVQYELSIETLETETHYILSDVSWLGQWAWDEVAPSIYDLLKTREPTNLANLNKLLKILQGSPLADDLIEELASRKCRTLEELDHVAHWFAVWTGVAPEAAIASLEARIGMVADPKQQTWFAMTFVTHLWGGHRVDGFVARQAFKTPEYLKALYLLMHKYIRVQEDINRAETGCYSPDLRDDAQDARDNLFSLLSKIPGKESFLALNDIAKVHSGKASQSRILLHAKTRAEQDSDIEPWSPLQVRDFHEKLERTPRNHRELAELAVMRLLDLKDDLEHGDSSIAGILQTVKQETDMRKYIGRELREKAFGRYSIPQEEELADAKRPDLRFHGVRFDGPVPVELKLAWKWSGPQLFERLENQLCGNYLRDNHSNRGIFLLVYRRGDKTHWELPGSGDPKDFAGLTAALQDYWWQISPRFANVDDITVIGIDLTKRSS